MKISRVGVDLAKNIFQLHGIIPSTHSNQSFMVKIEISG